MSQTYRIVAKMEHGTKKYTRVAKGLTEMQLEAKTRELRETALLGSTMTIRVVAES